MAGPAAGDTISAEQRVRVTLARLLALNDLRPIETARIASALPDLAPADVVDLLERLAALRVVHLQEEGWILRAAVPLRPSTRQRLLWH